MPDPACPCCGGQIPLDLGPIPVGHVFAGRPLDEFLPGGRLFRCSRCTLGFRWPRLPREAYTSLYQSASADAWHYDAPSRTDWRQATTWIQSQFPTGSVLDVGCYDGAFLSTIGTQYEKLGIEISDGAQRSAQTRGVKIIGADIAAIDSPRAVADAVVSFDVAEHVMNPREMLESMRNLTRPGGIIVLSTGNLDARTWRFMGSRYWYCTLAEHVSFLSPRWCEWAAKEVGLTLIAVRTFAHDSSASPVQKGREALGNMLFRTAPTLLRGMRQLGFGGLDVRANPELATIPPPWPSARDHFITLFRRM
jgi:SAM-dependent methyltransferase